MFTLFAAGALLCLALILIAFRSYLVIPWFICSIVEAVAWPLGWQTYVRARGGPGWHSGRIGAERLYFVRREKGRGRFPILLLMAAGLMVLPACQALKAVTGATVSPTAVVVAANAFNAVKATATNYIAYCTPNPAPAGCSDAAIKKLIPAVRAGTDARNSLEQFQAEHPGELGDKGVYDALTTATDTIKAIVAEYGVKS
jgi:hypothetical protein